MPNENWNRYDGRARRNRLSMPPNLDFSLSTSYSLPLKTASSQENFHFLSGQQSHRRDILRKLAQGDSNDDDGDGYGSSSYDLEGDMEKARRDRLTERLQSGMSNLQICFVNENDLTDSDGEEEEDDGFGLLPMRCVAAAAVEEEPSEAFTPGSEFSSAQSSELGENSGEDSETDFEAKQEKLQEAAKRALAEAIPKARKQLEIERLVNSQSVRPLSPDRATGFGRAFCRDRHLHHTKRALQSMTLQQIRTVVNDYTSQFKSLNEELMRQLISRDELHNEQDSKLVDIEDLTRWARMNLDREDNNNHAHFKKTTTTSLCRSQTKYGSLMDLLTRTLPVSHKCMCGLSRSSSMSSRTVGSPESGKSPASPGESLRSEATTETSDTGASGSRLSSPEMTWVRQALVKYWHT